MGGNVLVKKTSCLENELEKMAHFIHVLPSYNIVCAQTMAWLVSRVEYMVESEKL